MRKTLACVCVIALLPTGVLGQAPGEPPPLPEPSALSRSIASAIAAARSAPPAPPLASDQDRNRVSDWSRVQQLQPGTEATLTLTGSPAAKVRLLVASDDAVFVLRPGGPKVPDRVSRALIATGRQWPAVFSGGVTYAPADGVRVADGGVFDGNRRVADLAQVVQRAPREDVREIRVAGKRKGNKRMAAIGAAVGAGAGLLVGAFVGLSMGDKDCRTSCSDEKVLVGLSVIGLPIALGVLGYYGGSHTVGGMIYRAPPSAGDGLDEARGQEIRQSLPASHRDPAAR
jgi:hypothetical protein